MEPSEGPGGRSKCSAREDRKAASGVDVHYRFASVPLVRCHAVLLVGRDEVNEVDGDALSLLGRGPGGADNQVAVDLHGVRGHDLAADARSDSAA